MTIRERERRQHNHLVVYPFLDWCWNGAEMKFRLTYEGEIRPRPRASLPDIHSIHRNRGCSTASLMARQREPQ
jgi:hypothetical protein